MQAIKEIIKAGHLEGLFQQATFGIEKEGQRVDKQGKIAQTAHPSVFGDRQYHPYIQTDFAESQLELITPTLESEAEAIRWLEAIHEVTLKQLPQDEYMWPLSMPALLPKPEEILEAQMSPKDTAYRQYLSQKYGKYKQMVSGIHYNFGFSPDFLQALAPERPLYQIQNEIYMKVARQFMRYQWLLVYLYGSSIQTDPKYYGADEPLLSPVRSIRASHLGYTNKENIQVSYDSIEAYVASLEQHVAQGDLIAEKEFYSSVRFRGCDHAACFLDKGIKYIELRLFDINPFAKVGISYKQARFIHLFVLLMLWLEEEDLSLEDLHARMQEGKAKSEETALQNPFASALYWQEGHWLLDQMLAMAEDLGLSQADLDLIKSYKVWLDQPELTLAAQLATAYQRQDALAFGLQQAKAFKAALTQRPFGIQAFDNMELSTQALMEDALIQGISLSILDEDDQFLRLSYKGHVEYVKNGNMTSHDSYISPLMMANKVVTKKVLAEQGFSVPKSIQCRSLEEAMQKFSLVYGRPLVVKPKTTNFGLGITIFTEGVYDQADFQKAVQIALQEDREIMLEDYIAGTEYRFFVLDGQTEAVLLRLPAHVVGDGLHSVQELVALKNDNPLRGDGSKTPLKQIKLGEIEKLQLKEQGLSPESIVEAGHRVYLRANSNISTGGDSIDVTDQVHDSYKVLAAKIAQAMFAKVCGVDLILQDISQPQSPDNYGLIEANFNPMMMMHIYPAQGQSRRLTLKILSMLFPELLKGDCK